MYGPYLNLIDILLDWKVVFALLVLGIVDGNVRERKFLDSEELEEPVGGVVVLVVLSVDESESK